MLTIMNFLQVTLTQMLTDSTSQGVVDVVATNSQTDSINLIDMAMKGGWIMLVLLLLSMISLYILINRIIVFKRAEVSDPNFMARITDYIKSGEVKSAVIYCQASNTPLSRIVEKGLRFLGKPRSDIHTSMENAANVEMARIEKGLSAMSTIASAAPMIGFLGTVIGMVRAFWAMSNAGNNIDVSLLSGGIYEAMITTVGGLVVGILALFAYNYLVARVDKIANEMESFIQEFTVSVEE